ncbi:hypothetical protein FGRMN_5088 [Fusarium graminum]|nr:hypothetical protein FGRMN_5088 [Fusarium graminum]
MEDKDLAIHPALWGYDHEIPDRMPFQVIRVQAGCRSTKTASTKAQKAKSVKAKRSLLGAADAIIAEAEAAEPGAPPGAPPGPPWTQAELQITGVLSNELVVIVGFCLPQEAVDSVTPPAGRKQFDVNGCPIISKVPGAKFLVRPLNLQRCALFVLLEKNDEGLSRMVANLTGNEHRIVVFNEFMAGIKSTRKNTRLDLARKAINEFCGDYMRREYGNEVANTNTSGAALAQNQDSVWKNHTNPAVRLCLDLERLLVMLKSDGDAPYLVRIGKQLTTITAKF